MSEPKTVQAANKAEWDNPGNWAGPDLIAVYFSKQDTRLWVPKKIVSLGWTINLGHPKGPTLLSLIIVGLPLVVVAFFIWATSQK